MQAQNASDKETSLKLQTAVKAAEATIEALKHIPAAVEELRQRIQSLFAEQQRKQSAALASLQAAYAETVAERDRLVRLKNKTYKEVGRVSDKLETAEATKSRLEAKNAELKRLGEDVAQRRVTMRRVELLRNVQIIWSRRVFMQLQRALAKWR